MAEKQNLDSLNEKKLGDGKLSKEELSYIQSQEQLWYKNVGDKLFQDIIDTNTTILSQDKVLGNFVNEILNDSLLMKQIVAKSGLKFPGINQQLASKDSTEKYYMLVNILLHGCNAMSEVQANLVTNINKPAITGATIKSLHRFQKQGETVNGRSKADCLIGKKTIQQMLAKIGVQTKQNKVDSSFASSNITAKEKYDYNGQQQKQMDKIINDPILSDVEKTQKLIEVAKNTVEKGADGLDKKYGAVSYMMTRISDKIMRDKSPEEIQSIVDVLQSDQKALGLIKKYWNENSAKQFGVNPSLIKKTSNWAQDLTERKEILENNRGNIKVMISAYRGYLDTLSQDYKGLDWTTDIDEKLKDHVKQIDKFLYDIDNTILYKDDNILAKKMASLMNDPHSQRLLDSEYAKVFIKNKTKGSEQYEYYLSYNNMKKIISNPSLWGDKGKEKFVQLLRSMDNNDDSTLLVNSYESSDATKEITKEAVDKKLSQSKDTKDIMNKFNSLFKPNDQGNYSGEYNTLLQYIESGNEDAARQHLNKVLKGLSTDDAWYPNFIGGNDYIDDLMDSVKSLKEKEKETKKDIEQGLEDEISKLEKLEENGTISNTGQLQLDKLRTMKENDTLSLMVDNSYKEMKNAMIANSIGHEMRTQMLDKYPTLFSKGSGSLVDNYANVVGAGDYLSDSTVESIQSVIVEVIIQVILAIISFGAANAALSGARAIAGKTICKYLSKAAAESLVKKVIIKSGSLVFRGFVYSATTAVGNAVKQAQDINQGGEIFLNGISWDTIVSNSAMIGILSKFKALSELGKLKDGVTTAKTIKNFVATKLSNTATRVVAEEVSINLTQGGSKLIFGDGQFTTQDFIEASAQGLAFEMIPGMGDINVFKSGKDLMMKTIVNGKIYTGTIDHVLSKLEIDHPGTKSLVENNAKQKGVDKLVFKNQKKSSPNTKKESMPRERARNQLPPKSSEKIAELKQKNEVKKTELENNIKNLEQEKLQLLKQREEVLSSLDQANKPKDYKNLNNTLSNLRNQKALLESELAQMKTNPNNPAKNAYFMEHAKELVGKNIWIDGKNYSVSHINTNGSLEIKLKDGAERISLSSFTELQQRGQVNGFSDSGGSALKNAEADNHAKLQELFQGEKEYMTTRANDLVTKQQKLTEMDNQIRSMEEQLVGAKSFQNKVDERAKKLSDVNKKISANESANTKAWKDYLETDKLDGKYYNDIKQNTNGGKNNIPQSYNDTPDVKIENKISFEESLDKAAQGIADNMFKDVPSTKTDAVSRVEQFGFWLGNTKVGPSLQFLENAWKWLGDIKLKFPDINLGKKIDEIKKSIGESAIKKRLSIIDSYADKTFDQQVVFWQNNKNKDLSLREYQKIYEVLSGRKVDFQSKTPKYFRQGDNLENAWKKEFKDEIDSYITHASFISNSKVVGGDLHLDRGNEGIDVIPLIEIDFIPSYKTGEGVKIPRSDGTLSVGKIESFDPKTGEYKVVWKDRKNSYSKKLTELELNQVNLIEGGVVIERPDIAKARAEYESIKKDFDEAKASGIHNSYNLSQLEKTVNEKLTQLNKLTNNDLHLDQNGKVDVIDVNKGNQDGIINKNNVEVKKQLLFSEYHKDFELFVKNKDQFSSADYKNLLENQFSDIRSQDDLKTKLAYHLIGIAQMRRISSNAHVGYRWGASDSQHYAKFIQDKIGSQLEDVVLKKYLNDIVDGKMIEYEDMKKITQHIFNKKEFSNTIGEKFIKSFVGSGKRVVGGKKDNPIISMENLPDGKQRKTYHQAGIVEEGYFNESGKLNGQWEAKRTNAKGDVQVGIFENGKLIDGNTINRTPIIDAQSVQDHEKFSKGPQKEFIVDKLPDNENNAERIKKIGEWTEKKTDILKKLSLRGKEYDKSLNNYVLSEDDVLFHGTFKGRPIVEIKMPNGKSEYFYKSTGWGEKNGPDVSEKRQVFGGFADAYIPLKGYVENWLIKDTGYATYYGSNTFKNIAESLDNILIQKNNLNTVKELNDMIGFRGTKDTYNPDIGLSSKKVDNEIPTLEISSIIESEKPADGAIIQGVDYEPNDVQSIRVDIEDISNSDYGNQPQQDDYRNKKQQEEDEFLNDMIINNAGADMFRGMDE